MTQKKISITTNPADLALYREHIQAKINKEEAKLVQIQAKIKALQECLPTTL